MRKRKSIIGGEREIQENERGRLNNNKDVGKKPQGIILLTISLKNFIIRIIPCKNIHVEF